jgi:hypothetical protein
MRKLWFPDAQALVLTAATRSVWLDDLSLPTHPDRQLGADSGEIVGITTNPTNLRESNRCARDLALSRHRDPRACGSFPQARHAEWSDGEREFAPLPPDRG